MSEVPLYSLDILHPCTYDISRPCTIDISRPRTGVPLSQGIAGFCVSYERGTPVLAQILVPAVDYSLDILRPCSQFQVLVHLKRHWSLALDAFDKYALEFGGEAFTGAVTPPCMHPH